MRSLFKAVASPCAMVSPIEPATAGLVLEAVAFSSTKLCVLRSSSRVRYTSLALKYAQFSNRVRWGVRDAPNYGASCNEAGVRGLMTEAF